ncbi:hypothetical protein DDB_G0293190 [Dictyostelium discoideum AX4]|uniref:FHA domain-containing protein n=1 Tax=Dictyostelium discoideum TaxID=44689 RepID=Q54C63_DICDI|nr:hypothetical protein DDB_G0293190 [Dictyostelium discoideum AX4]EAL60947.1 hypothetical protein DDB_G0293190 [Dictyostelium discoideum AX4]|eukprot:XP_629356.1 hypothetical protein DDB_G0293190 [Dictyostelium discoideum AX4]
MSDDDNAFEEIRKLQNARKNKVKLYDDDDDDNHSEKYDRSISTSKHKSSKKTSSSSSKRNYDDDDDNDDTNERLSLKREFESYSAPKHILETVPVDDDYDPTKSYRQPTVAEQENEYRSRWRKRGLSPPRDYDPFTGKGEVMGRTYRDIMMENQLVREEKEILQKIEKKKKEEQELEKQRKRQEEYDNKHNKKHKSDSNSSNNNKHGGGDVTPPYRSSSSSNSSSSSSKWFYKVFKNGEVIEDLKEIKNEEILTFGRDPSRNKILLEHPSCSSVHASISFSNSNKRPILLDLNSTNQTFLNGKEVTPRKPSDLYEGDKIKFGASTREYIIFKR